ncbi:MAG TPA: MBL fold metallo-hydrolase [Pyrinomonadaceae bacterium]|jgi:glyoxylase-like metal-dependent hydrolase (beta-lactamase superfamily II)
MFRKSLVVFLLLSFSLPAVFAHDKHENGQDVTVKTQKIGGNISMLQGRGGNVGASVGADGILIVDDDYAEVSPKIAEALKALGSEKPRFILNTHWHGDHTGGNKYFGKDSLIVAHANVRRRLSTEQTVFGEKIQPYPESALPDITYEQTLSIYFNGEEIRVVHFPNGHTDGDSVIFFSKSNVVHTGDHFFKDRFPFVDLGSGGSVQGLTKNVAEIIRQISQISADVKIIPGHGALASLDDLKTYHQMLIETTDSVQKGIAAGKTLEGLKKDGLPEKYKSWGTGFIKTDFWIETIYNSLTKK